METAGILFKTISFLFLCLISDVCYEKMLQHVMKFAEMSQEVLVTRSQQVNFNTGFTPGRRRMHQQYAEKMERQPGIS